MIRSTLKIVDLVATFGSSRMLGPSGVAGHFTTVLNYHQIILHHFYWT